MDLIDLTVACLMAVAQMLLQPFRFPLCKVHQTATGHLEMLVICGGNSDPQTAAEIPQVESDLAPLLNNGGNCEASKKPDSDSRCNLPSGTSRRLCCGVVQVL